MVNITQEDIISRWEYKDSSPVISICTITYNHENFISDALDSFLSQEINVPYEIIIDDDASKDNTQKIISEYVKRYPKIIKANLREQNVGFEKNLIDNLSRANGKFIAYCEGDDYWIDNKKLQMQYDALKDNQDCSLCGHDSYLVTYDKKPVRLYKKGRVNQNWKSGIYDSKTIIGVPLITPHASALFFRRDLLDLNIFKKVPISDYTITVILCTKGQFYYIDKPMSAYRDSQTSITSKREYKNFISSIIYERERLIEVLNGKYKEEIERNLNGFYVSMYEQELLRAIDSKSFFNLFKNFILLLRHSKNSQYTKRDILWILKNALLKKA